MFFERFVETLALPEPPPELELALRALWFDANGRAGSALRAATCDSSHAGLRVRAYLHRKAGDDAEAELWYFRSGAPPWTGSLRAEWEDIVKTVLADRVVANAYT